MDRVFPLDSMTSIFIATESVVVCGVLLRILSHPGHGNVKCSNVGNWTDLVDYKERRDSNPQTGTTIFKQRR